jgi:carbon monoxide dehydrogenase subunit G
MAPQIGAKSRRPSPIRRDNAPTARGSRARIGYFGEAAMARIEGTVTIRRSVEEVFDFMNDPENDPKWQPEVLESHADGPLGVGTTLSLKRKLMGRELEARAEIIEYERPRKSAVRSTSGPFPFEGGYEFEEVDSSTTRVHFYGDVQPGGFFKLAEGLVVKQLQKEFESNLANLKALLEG